MKCGRYLWRVSVCAATMVVLAASAFADDSGTSVSNIYVEDFESGASSWTTTGCWAVGIPRSGPNSACESMNCAATDLNAHYPHNADDWLRSPAIVLPPITDASHRLRLRFNEWLDIEKGYDQAQVLISTNGGSDWTALGASPGTNQWTETAFDLTAYPNRSVNLGFRLRSDNTVAAAGWHVDNVRVQFESPAPLAATVTSLNSLNFPYVYMNVAVQTNGGDMTTLSATNFMIYENGELQTEGLEVIPPSESGGARLADIVFLMDNSGSMGDEQDEVASNVTEFVDNLVAEGIDYAFGLCRYGQSADSGDPIIQDSGILTSDPDYFKDNVWQRNDVSGGTEPGYDALVESAASFNFRPGAQKVFIIITDETPDQGTETVSNALDACVGIGATVFALTQESLYPDFEPITDGTGGQCFNVYSNFDAIFDEICAFIANSYLVRFRSTDPETSGETRNLEVVVNYGGMETTAAYAYVPRSTPRIERTAYTLGLHSNAWAMGTAFRIEARIVDHVEPFTESAMLYYKNTATSGFHSMAMSNVVGNLWEGRIPFGYADTPGLDYFMTTTDGTSSSSDPSVAPMQNCYQLAVAPNWAPQITHTPVVSPPVSNDLVITADITDTTASVDTAKLFYRKTGQLLYQEAQMSCTGGSAYEGMIPANYVTADGVDYYIRARDDQGVGAYHGAPDQPHQTRAPEISVSPLTLTQGLLTGETAVQSLAIISEGSGGGPLAFEATPGDHNRPGVVTFAPITGYLPTPGASTTIDVVFDASGLNAGTYTADVAIASNDPDEPRVIVTGALTVKAACDMALSANALDFGTVFTGATASQTLWIVNVGFDILNVSAVTVDNAIFAPSVSSMALAPGESNMLSTLCSPLVAGTSTGALTIVSDDPDTPNMDVTLRADALSQPDIVVTPSSFSANVASGDSGSFALTIDNSGGGSDLIFDLSIVDSNAAAYTWSDSDDPGGPDFQWFDVSDVGASVGLSGYGGSATVALPVAFPFFGKPRTNVTISGYGYLTFGASAEAHDNAPIPTPASPNDVIAPFWDYLYVGAGRCVTYYDTVTGRYIVQFSNMTDSQGDSSYTFQAHLCQNGEIFFYYKTMSGALDGATIGIENGYGTAGRQMAHNSAYAHDDLAVRIRPPVTASVSVNSSGGSIPVGNALSLEALFDTQDLPTGLYALDVVIQSNDPDAPLVTVPIQLNVSAAPDITVDASHFDFATCYLGYSYTNVFRIANSGSDTLTIDSVSSDNTEYAVSVTNGSLAPGEWASVQVCFSPAAVGASTGDIAIVSNDPDEPVVTVALSGLRLDAPCLAVDTNAIVANLFPDTTRIHTLTLDNSTGGSPLNFEIMVMGAAMSTGAAPEYAWSDSDRPGGPAFTWQDISGIGANLGLSGDDSYVTVALPFDFPFYGDTFSNVTISCNGYLTFGPDGSDYSNDSIPNSSDPDALIALFWDDLHSGSGHCYTYHDTTKRVFIVQYTDWQPLGGGALYTMQAHLHRGGSIFFYYQSMSADLQSATIGIEDADGSTGLEAACNEAYIHNGLVVSFTPANFLSLDTRTGSVPAGVSMDVELTFNASNLMFGAYYGNLAISCNDPALPEVDIPIQLNVTDVPDIAVVESSLDFGACSLGYSVTNTVTAQNNGAHTLTVTSVTSDNGDYAASPQTFAVAPGDAMSVSVAFTPVGLGVSTGALTIASNDPDTPIIVVPLLGEAELAPCIGVDASPIRTNLYVGASIGHTLDIDNSAGLGDLDFTLSIERVVAGGDAFGYFCTDSDQAGGPAFEWLELAGLGAPSGLTGDDACVTSSLPFAFPFYDRLETSVVISCNGYLTFGSNGTDYANDPIPSAVEPNGVIAPFWDDLHQSGGASFTHYDVSRQRFIIQYTHWGCFSGAADYTFQVHLCENGDIYYYYKAMTGTLDSASVGCENEDGSMGLQIAYGESYVHDDLAALISRPRDFLTVNTPGGTIPAGGSANIQLTLSASNLNAVAYDAFLVIASNDPEHPIIRIPVHLDVDGLFVDLPYAEWAGKYWPFGGSGGASYDYDGDGVDNYGEWGAGTDPTRRSSVFRVYGMTREPDDGFCLRWPSVSNRTYTVEWSASLQDGFSVLESNLMATPVENCYTDTVHSVERRGFYRVRAVR